MFFHVKTTAPSFPRMKCLQTLFEDEAVEEE